MITIGFELGDMSDRTYEFLDKGFDVAFHTRNLRDSRVRLQRIAAVPLVLCGSPRYVKKWGSLGHPNELADQDCLVHHNDPVWRIGLGKGSTLHKVRRVAMLSNSYIALQKAAIYGRGIALLPQRSVYDNRVGGSLVPLLPTMPVPDRALYANFGPDRQVPLKVKVFLDFLSDWFEKNPIPRLSELAT